MLSRILTGFTTNHWHLEQNVADVDAVLLLHPIAILMHDHCPYQTAYHCHGVELSSHRTAVGHDLAAIVWLLQQIAYPIFEPPFGWFYSAPSQKHYRDMAPAIWKSKWFRDVKLPHVWRDYVHPWQDLHSPLPIASTLHNAFMKVILVFRAMIVINVMP